MRIDFQQELIWPITPLPMYSHIYSMYIEAMIVCMVKFEMVKYKNKPTLERCDYTQMRDNQPYISTDKTSRMKHKYLLNLSEKSKINKSLITYYNFKICYIFIILMQKNAYRTGQQQGVLKRDKKILLMLKNNIKDSPILRDFLCWRES